MDIILRRQMLYLLLDSELAREREGERRRALCVQEEWEEQKRELSEGDAAMHVYLRAK